MFTTIKKSFLSVSTFGLVSLGNLVYAPASQAADIDLSSWQQDGDVIKYPSNATLTNAYSDGSDDLTLPLNNNSKVQNTYFNPSNPNYNPLASYNAISLDGGDTSKSLEDFLGIATASLPKNGSIFGVTEGSAIRGNISASANDVFQFTYNFRSNEALRPNDPMNPANPRNDYAFAIINGDTANSVIASVSDANIPDNSAYAFQTGNKVFSYVFPTSGNYDISLGVVDVQSYGYSSSLAISNPTLQAAQDSGVQSVPEPMTIVGSIIALGGGTALRRRFGKIAK